MGNNNTAIQEVKQEADTQTVAPQKAPESVLSEPALLFLYYRIEQILGIKTGYEPLKNLNEFIEKTTGSSFVENPAAFDNMLTAHEKIYQISSFITVNETYFFRESAHFDFLAALLPELKKLNRQIQICSAACSIGCEAYSIAMLCDYHKKNGTGPDFAIDAFDVSNEIIEKAKTSVYTANALRNDGKNWQHLLDQYLIHDKKEFTVSDEIKKRVRFFPHNIMKPLNKKYDIIFFRNALIYFSEKNRYTVLNNLYDSLEDNGILFLGVSETSSIKHPLFNCCHSDTVFYFKKHLSGNEEEASSVKPQNSNQMHFKEPLQMPLNNVFLSKKQKPFRSVKKDILPVYFSDIQDILKTDEGKQNAFFVLDLIDKDNAEVLFGSQLAAAVIFFLHSQEPENADRILSFLENHNNDACTKFLRGEYHYLLENYQEAENFYQQACFKDKCFWPAFYRIAVLSQEGNPTRYEYKVKKTLESIELSKIADNGKENNYECFMGGFSIDYFERILEKKIA